MRRLEEYGYDDVLTSSVARSFALAPPAPPRREPNGTPSRFDAKDELRDELTGCYGAGFLSRQAAEIEGRLPSWGCVAVDVEDLGRYNARFGREAGDQVLMKVSRFLL